VNAKREAEYTRMPKQKASRWTQCKLAAQELSKRLKPTVSGAQPKAKDSLIFLLLNG